MATSYDIVQHEPHLIIRIRDNFTLQETLITSNDLLKLWLNNWNMYPLISNWLEYFLAAVHNEHDTVTPYHFSHNFNIPKIIQSFIDVSISLLLDIWSLSSIIVVEFHLIDWRLNIINCQGLQ